MSAGCESGGVLSPYSVFVLIWRGLTNCYAFESLVNSILMLVAKSQLVSSVFATAKALTEAGLT